MRHLSGKTALITGASRGIGAQIANTLAEEGLNLILVARSQKHLEMVAGEVRKSGCSAHILTADLSQRQTLEPLVRQAMAFTGRIDILINNAAIACFLPFHLFQPEDLEREIFTNITAPLLLTRYVLPYMLQQQSGHIVNISSLAAEVPVAYLASYSAAKAGMASFTRSLRQELAGTGVSASAVMPGVVRDRGMIRDFEHDSGFAATAAAGGCTSQQVAKAVVRAVRRDLPDVVIDRRGTRLLLALLRLWPRTMERTLDYLGIQESSKRAVDINVGAGGGFTMATMASGDDEQTKGKGKNLE